AFLRRVARPLRGACRRLRRGAGAPAAFPRVLRRLGAAVAVLGPAVAVLGAAVAVLRAVGEGKRRHETQEGEKTWTHAGDCRPRPGGKETAAARLPLSSPPRCANRGREESEPMQVHVVDGTWELFRAYF